MLIVRRKIYCLALLGALSMLPVMLPAQTSYSIKNFTNENGLSQNSITDMAMDYSGYLWIGTQQGVIRYDGSSFKTFLLDKERPDAFYNNVWGIMNTPFDKQLLIRAKSSKLYYIQKGQPQLLDSSLKRNFAATSIQGQYPTLAAAKQFNLSEEVLNMQLKWSLNVQIAPLNPYDFLVGNKYKDSLILYKMMQVPKYIPLPGRFRMLMRSHGHVLVVCAPGDIYLYDSLRSSLVKMDLPDRFKPIVSEMTKGSTPDFFHGLYSGECFMFYRSSMYLLQVNPGNSIDFIPQFTLPKSYRINKVVYDSVNATYFLGTANEGILQVKLQKIKTFDINALLPPGVSINNYINYALLRIDSNTVLTASGFRFTTSDTGIAVRQVANEFSTRQTVARLGDSAVLGTGPNGIVYYLHRENYKIPHIYNDSITKLTKKMGELSMLLPEGDSVWVSSLQYLYCISRTRLKEYTPQRKIPHPDLKVFQALQLFYRLNNNEVLISSGKGFYKMTLSPTPVYEDVPGMEGVVVRHLNPYKDVLIAAGYRKGIYILKEGRGYKVPLPEELQDLKTCHSTYIDKEGYIWITTNKGLFKSTAESVVQAALTQGAPPYFFCFGRNDGIDNLEFNGGGVPAYALMPDGRVFYPSMGGIVTFNPADLKDRISDWPVYIENILVDKKMSSCADSIWLPADFAVLDVELSAGNFGDPRNLAVEYRLDNGEWEKLRADKELRITLVKIASGWHELVIRKRTGFGDNDYVYTYLFINRYKKINEKWWFFPLILLLLTGFIWLLLRWRTRSLIRKREQLQELVNIQTEELSKAVEAKDMMIGIITHDMLTPLKHVSFIAGILEKGMEKDPQKMTEALRDIKETSDKIHSGSQSIVNWMKYNNKNVPVNKQTLHLYSFADAVLDVYRALAKNKNITLVNDVRKSAFVEADHNIFTTIVTNIISNAVKHTSGGQIKIQTIATGDKMILQVSDTGAGIDESTLTIIREVLKGNLQSMKEGSKVAPGLGYIIISELIKIHNLSITIESKPGNGTTVSLII